MDRQELYASVTAQVVAQIEPAAGAFFSAIGADVRHGGNDAFYSPVGDYVTLPDLSAFEKASDYYATSAHEHAHWSGHASRLARDLTGRFGTDAYALEELVAELAAAYVAAASLGIETQPRADHTQYLAAWIRVLRSDSRAIYRAATAAQTAA